MKILIISNLYPPHFLGGYEILCEQVVGILKRNGHNVLVLTSNHQNPEVVENSPSDKVLRRLRLYCPFNKKAELQRFDRLKTGLYNYRVTRSILRRFHPDLVFVWSQLRLTLASAKAAQSMGYRCFFTFNDDHIAGYKNSEFSLSPKDLIKYLLDKTLFRFNCIANLDLSHSTSISIRLRGQICEKGVDIRNSHIIYQGIPIEKFPLRDRAPEIPAVNAKILYAGQLHHYKGVHTLIKAVHLLPRNRFASITLNIVGTGSEEYMNELRHLASLSNIEVNFLGRLPGIELPELYRTHDVFVFPSIWPEPFGLTHLEAMASGTPVISTNDGGHGEFLEDEINALIFAKDDEKALAGQLERVLFDAALVKKISTNARRMVEEQFTLARYVARLEKLLFLIASGAEG